MASGVEIGAPANLVRHLRGGAFRQDESLHPALRGYVDAVGRILDGAPADDALALVRREMAALLAVADLLTEDQRRSDPYHYNRHILAADPAGRFTVLALVWEPGQRTAVHGHRAWGVVGVYEGGLSATSYRHRPRPDNPMYVEQTGEAAVGAGALCVVRPAAEGIHRLHNRFDRQAISIHTYGMDLADDPSRINEVYAE